MLPEPLQLLEWSARASLILALAFAVTLLLRRRTAATRHLVWTCAVTAALLLPVLQAAVPDWQIVPRSVLPQLTQAPRPTPASATDLGRPRRPDDGKRSAAGASTVPDARALPLPLIWQKAVTASRYVSTMWALGTAAVLGYMLLGLAASWRIRRQAVPSSAGDEAQELAEALAIASPIAVVESAATSTPLVCGLWRPRIVLPPAASEWTDERRHVVMLHELAHVKRRDCLTQAIAQFVCALYWFNPLAWIAARRLRVERERACDDFVLAAGIRGSDYANHLLGIAQAAPRPGLSPLATAAVAMARRSQLEGRLMAILDPAIQRSRGPHARLSAVFVAVLALPIAALQPQASAVVARDTDVTSRPAPADSTEAAGDGKAAPGSVVPRSAAAPQNPTQSVKDALLLQTLNATLIEFADEGHIDGVVAMLAAGADVNAVVPGDGSPLIAAADEGQFDVVRLLLDRGADPNLAVDGDGSPLIAAAGEGHADVVQLLLDRGANPNLGVIGDGSALIAAAGEGHADVVQLLLDRGADVNLAVDGDETALIQASDEGHLDIVKLLVARGADVNADVWADQWRWTVGDARGFGPERRSELRTPLGAARREGHVDIVTYLISMGARD